MTSSPTSEELREVADGLAHAKELLESMAVVVGSAFFCLADLAKAEAERQKTERQTSRPAPRRRAAKATKSKSRKLN